MKKIIKRESFQIYAALYGEAKEGWVWIDLKDYRGNFITIRNPFTDKSITCMLRTIDSNFITYYNGNNIYGKTIQKDELPIVISEHFRKLLGIGEAGKKEELELYRPSIFEKYIKVYLQNPNPFIRVGIILGMISVILGLIPLLPCLYKFIVSLVTCLYSYMSLNGCR